MNSKLFINNKNNRLSPYKAIAFCMQSRFVLFLFIGALNTGFSYSVYAFFLFLGLSYPVANLLACIAGIFCSFKTQGIFVFKNSASSLLGRFIAAWVIIYCLNVLFIGQIIAFGFNDYSAGALAIPPLAVLSYLIQKHFVFRRSHPC